MKKVVTIGGGNGSPTINEALLRTGKVNYINAITAVFDTGGATGRRRTDSRGQEIAYSDPMRNLLSLVPPAYKEKGQYKALVELMTSRSWGKVLGQEVFAHFHEDGDGFDKVQKQLSKLTGIKFNGKVLPSTTCSTNLVFSTQSGRVHVGEDQLDLRAMSCDMVERIWLESSCKAYEEAVSVIEKAQVIFLSCGSMYGSVLCNLLPKGMKEAFKKTKAKVYMVTNLVSTRIETHDFTPMDFVNVIKTYTGIKPSGLIIPSISKREFNKKYPKVSKLYSLDHSYFLGWEEEDLKKFAESEKDVKIIKHDAISIAKTQSKEKVIRHNPEKLSEVLKDIL